MNAFVFFVASWLMVEGLAQKNTPASPVIVVDQYSGYSSFDDNYDQIHPNDAGEAIMATRRFDALLPRIQGSCGQ